MFLQTMEGRTKEAERKLVNGKKGLNEINN